MKKLFVAFSHTLTDSQIEDFFKMVCDEPFSVHNVSVYPNVGVEVIRREVHALNSDMKTIAKIVTLAEVAPKLQAQMSQIPATATLAEIQELAKAIVAEAIKVGATHFYCVGEPTLTLWANLYASKVAFEATDGLCFRKPSGMLCIQSTTERKSVEVTNPDGTVTKTQTFSHVQWREMF